MSVLGTVAFWRWRWRWRRRSGRVYLAPRTGHAQPPGIQLFPHYRRRASNQTVQPAPSPQAEFRGSKLQVVTFSSLNQQPASLPASQASQHSLSFSQNQVSVRISGRAWHGHGGGKSGQFVPICAHSCLNHSYGCSLAHPRSLSLVPSSLCHELRLHQASPSRHRDFASHQCLEMAPTNPVPYGGSTRYGTGQETDGSDHASILA